METNWTKALLSVTSKVVLIVIAVLGSFVSGKAQHYYYVASNTSFDYCVPTEAPNTEPQTKSHPKFYHDYLMPGKGNSTFSFYTGVPYIGVGEFAYGISNRFSASMFLGYTPINHAYGLRLKAVVAQPSTNFRINLKTTIIYYPFMENGKGDPWMLGWQAANAEWRLRNGSSLWAGAGVLGLSCVDMLFPSKGSKMMKKDGEKEMEIEGVFNTFQIGYSKPISNHSSFVIEVAPVMEGFKLKSKTGFLDAVPMIITAGFTHTF